jgi:hypothetical protein
VTYSKKKIPSFFKNKRRPVAGSLHPGRMIRSMTCNEVYGARYGEYGNTAGSRQEAAGSK